MNRANDKKLFPGIMAVTMARNDLNQVKMSAKSGIAVSRINNYLKGKYRNIRPSHISSILDAAASNKMERAQLVEAYLMDLMPESAKGLVSIKVDPTDMKAWYLQHNRLPNGFAGLFEELYVLCVSHPKVRARTATWIEITKESLK